jgi:hypothetical protein
VDEDVDNHKDDDDDLDDLDDADDADEAPDEGASVPPKAVRRVAVADDPRFHAARAALDRLIASSALVLTKDADLDALSEAMADALARLARARRPASALADWLTDRPEVDELFADDDTLERALAETR